MFIKSVTFRFMISSFISVLGNASASVILPVVLLIKTGDPLAAGTLSLLCGLPMFLAGILGGALLDRFNRRSISVISDLISAACVAVLPIVEMTVGLSFGWFAGLGILGAIGDIPGMTARDVLFPSAVKRDGLDLQRFIGIWQSLDSLAVIIGPAMASVLIGAMGNVPALWVTAALSLIAALVTLSIPASVGDPHAESNAPPSTSMLSTLKDGIDIMFKSDRVITFSMILSAGIVIITAGYQGLIFPVHFTEIGRPDLLGYVLSMLALGNIIGPVIYSIFVDKLSRRRWYVISFFGMGIGLSVMGILPCYPLLLAAACFTGIACGPLSSLLGFLIIDRIPEDKRGSVMGMQNAFMLILPPVFIFFISALVTWLGLSAASLACIGFLWLVIFYGLITKHMKEL